jgi:hypothetical protein
VSDFVQKLVLRAAGLPVGLDARPASQPSFVPGLPTGPAEATTPWATPGPTSETPPRGEPPAPRRATAPAQMPSLPPQRQDERPRASIPLGRDGAETAPSSPEPEHGAARTPTGALPPLEGRSPTPVEREQGATTADQPPPRTTTGPVEPSAPVGQSPGRTMRSEQPAPPDGARAVSRAVPAPQPSGDGGTIWRPPMDHDVEELAPPPQPVSQAQPPPIAAETEATSLRAVEPGASPRGEPPTPRDPSPTSRATAETAGPAVRPAPAPPAPRLTIGSSAPPRATAAEAPRAVEVHIGTIEVRASRPVPATPSRPRRQPEGFDRYAQMRGRARDERGL